MNNSEWHVCSLVVQAKPARVEDLISELTGWVDTDVVTAEQRTGKIIVVMCDEDSRQLLHRIESVRNLDGVLVVSLVYHQQDEQAEVMS